MAHEAILLRVAMASGCSLLRPGDRWIISPREVTGLDGARICLHAVYQLYPNLPKWIGDPSAPNGTFTCRSAECSAVFTVEPWTDAGGVPAKVCISRRMEGESAEPETNLRGANTFMSRLSPELALEIVAVAGRRQGQPGTKLLAAGTRGERLLIVAEGEVEVVRVSARGHAETVLAVLGAGDCFGEMSILTDQPTSAAVRARTDCTLYTLTRPQLERLLNSSPELARVFSQLLSERLQALNRTLESELERGMRGQFSTLPFAELVQLLHAGRKTGTLTIKGPGSEARLDFLQGRLAGAVSGSLTGEEVFFAVARWPEGEFRLEPGRHVLPEGAQVNSDTLALLMESLRRLDEAQAAPD